MQLSLDIQRPLTELEYEPVSQIKPFKKQLLKWIGNKQRFAHEIISYFPESFGTYYEPFLGSGAVLGTLAPRKAIGSDCFKPLVGIWQTLSTNPDQLKEWYSTRWEQYTKGGGRSIYEAVKADFNANPNAADLLFLSRTCYGGVVRFRKADGYMSTPCGPHKPVPPHAFAARVDEWHKRTLGTKFHHMDFTEAFDNAKAGDLIYCDPPYSHSQSILYGAQDFSLEKLLGKIEECKSRGIFIALSIDGSKKSGNYICDLPIPTHLFEQEISVNCGRSMLKRFQKEGETLEDEVVTDRLLLTY